MNPKKTFSAGGIVVNSHGKILVVNQNNDSWSLPKGHIDPGEDALMAAKREIEEESGVHQWNLTLVRELGSYERYRIGLDGDDDTSELKNIAMIQFKTGQEHLCPTDSANPEARWVDKEKVSKLLTHTADKAFFDSVVDTL